MLLVGVNDDGFGGGVVEIPLLEKSPMPGDADGNGAVEFADFLILSSNFGKNADAAFADGDFNEDGKVNFNDFLLLSTNFGR
jgi:Ca2+-binding EF-hand superfamily protein